MPDMPDARFEAAFESLQSPTNAQIFNVFRSHSKRIVAFSNSVRFSGKS